MAQVQGEEGRRALCRRMELALNEDGWCAGAGSKAIGEATPQVLSELAHARARAFAEMEELEELEGGWTREGRPHRQLRLR